jgi:hypothetical protein
MSSDELITKFYIEYKHLIFKIEQMRRENALEQIKYNKKFWEEPIPSSFFQMFLAVWCG